MKGRGADSWEPLANPSASNCFIPYSTSNASSFEIIMIMQVKDVFHEKYFHFVFIKRYVPAELQSQKQISTCHSSHIAETLRYKRKHYKKPFENKI